MINIIPAAKLAREPCKAKPIAKPAAAIIAARDVVSTPSWLNAAIETKATAKPYIMLPAKATSVASTFDLSIAFLTMPTSFLATHLPIMNMAIAARTLRPYTLI